MSNRDHIEFLGLEMRRRRSATQAQLDEVQTETETAVVAAVEFTRQAPYPEPEQAFEDIYSE